jgi:uncharacterized membrane protein YfcA
MFAISSEFIRSMMSASSGLLSFMWLTTAYIATSASEASVRQQHPHLGIATLAAVGGLGRACVLIAAGLVAGAVGAAGGVTSLVSYSALLGIGVPPLQANVCSLVAAVACWPGSAATSRRELARTNRSLTGMLALAGCAAAVGSVALLVTPPGVFVRIAPFLVALASLVMLVQPRLTARAARRTGRLRLLTWPLIGLVSIYSGYFGAGSGIMLLALLLVLVDNRVPEANAIKNMLLGAATLASAVVFVVAGPVDWTAVVPLGAGLFAGSALGPVIARRVPPRALRWAVAGLGLALAVGLWWRQD